MISSGTGFASPDRGLPTVSIVIPMRNEERCIAPCLDAVLSQTYPSHLMEIVVVDGNSQDRSGQIVADYARRDARIKLLPNPTGTIPAGLNVGIRASSGEVIARVDARTLLASDYLRVAVRLLDSTGADNVGGPVHSISSTLTGRALALAWGSRFGLGGASARYRESGEHWVDTVYLGVYPRRIFEAIGLYDETVVQDEDTELNYRLRSQGGRILMSPRLHSYYLNSPSFRRLAWKNLLFGYCKVVVWQKHPRMIRWRHFVPPLFAAALLFGPFLALIHWSFGALWIFGVASYLLMCLWVMGYYLLHGEGREALLLPLVFPLLHLSWGAGFLVGMVRFFSGWFWHEPGPPPLSLKPAPVVQKKMGFVTAERQ
jgi:glycosyltransferase involved in cell wall biosynthesis